MSSKKSRLPVWFRVFLSNLYLTGPGLLLGAIIGGILAHPKEHLDWTEIARVVVGWLCALALLSFLVEYTVASWLNPIVDRWRKVALKEARQEVDDPPNRQERFQ
jgi:phosphate/sulfate permease